MYVTLHVELVYDDVQPADERNIMFRICFRGDYPIPATTANLSKRTRTSNGDFYHPASSPRSLHNQEGVECQTRRRQRKGKRHLNGNLSKRTRTSNGDFYHPASSPRSLHNQEDVECQTRRRQRKGKRHLNGVRHPDVHNDEIDVAFNSIADSLTTDESIEALGKQLGFKYQKVSVFLRDNNSSSGASTRGTLRMLREWRDTVLETEVRYKFRLALEKANLKNYLDLVK